MWKPINFDDTDLATVGEVPAIILLDGADHQDTCQRLSEWVEVGIAHPSLGKQIVAQKHVREAFKIAKLRIASTHMLKARNHSIARTLSSVSAAQLAASDISSVMVKTAATGMYEVAFGSLTGFQKNLRRLSFPPIRRVSMTVCGVVLT